MFPSWFECYMVLLILYLVRGHIENFKLRCIKEAQWGDWRCPGEEQKCMDDEATRYKCLGGNCTVDSPCVTMEGYQVSRPLPTLLWERRYCNEDSELEPILLLQLYCNT